MNLKIKTSLFLFMTAISINSFANEDHSEHLIHHTIKIVEDNYSSEYADINNKMHKGMMFDSTGNPDVDFVIGMIAHHKGAVEMAKVQLKYGKDSKLIELSNNIIRDQEIEIKLMENWLSKEEAEKIY